MLNKIGKGTYIFGSNHIKNLTYFMDRKSDWKYINIDYFDNRYYQKELSKLTLKKLSLFNYKSQCIVKNKPQYIDYLTSLILCVCDEVEKGSNKLVVGVKGLDKESISILNNYCQILIHKRKVESIVLFHTKSINYSFPTNTLTPLRNDFNYGRWLDENALKEQGERFKFSK